MHHVALLAVLRRVCFQIRHRVVGIDRGGRHFDAFLSRRLAALVVTFCLALRSFNFGHSATRRLGRILLTALVLGFFDQNLF